MLDPDVNGIYTFNGKLINNRPLYDKQNKFGIWYTGFKVSATNWNLGPLYENFIEDEKFDWGYANNGADSMCPENETDVWSEFYDNEWGYNNGVVTCVNKGKLKIITFFKIAF